MHFALLLLALLGHAVLWVALINRIHATAVPHTATRVLSVVCLVCLIMLPVGFWWYCLPGDLRVLTGFAWRQIPAGALLYLGCCWIAAGAAVVTWTWRVVHRPPAVLRYHRTRSILPGGDTAPGDTAGPAWQEHSHHFLVHLPGNEILRLDVTERAIEVPRLPSALDGLSIVHLSDFHFTGRVGKEYFQEVVRRSNRLEPDLVAISGDLVDYSAYIDWIPDTLGQLTARFGVYFVLGNHDVRVDTDRLRSVLHDSGLVDLGGRWIEVAVRGQPVVLAGNELPWLAPAADMRRCPKWTAAGRPLRIVVSHSPDQLRWAQAQDADLLLAGHTHGGQIRIPVIGPIFAPSSVGVKYASGVFHAPPTIMHVTRGLSAELPIRFNCTPEMARLILHTVQ
jgi:predicted MPP superfamily phosphohydrolase